MSENTLPVYVGYDAREHAAWLVCQSTILRSYVDPLIPVRGTPQVYALPINHRQLRREGVFDRPWRITDIGQFIDERDGKPFSTEFSHSRFLTPYLAAKGRPRGKRGWALFCDCDFFFRASVTNLLELVDSTKAVLVVKHAMPAEGKKMDGMVQQAYPRKLWSSMILWNLDHPSNDVLIDHPFVVNLVAGGDLHRFSWLKDDEIGELPVEWNWIPGISPEIESPLAVHFSLGGPWMAGYDNVPFAREWMERFAEIIDGMSLQSQAIGDFADLFPLL